MPAGDITMIGKRAPDTNSEEMHEKEKGENDRCKLCFFRDWWWSTFFIVKIATFSMIHCQASQHLILSFCFTCSYSSRLPLFIQDFYHLCLFIFSEVSFSRKAFFFSQKTNVNGNEKAVLIQGRLLIILQLALTLTHKIKWESKVWF